MEDATTTTATRGLLTLGRLIIEEEDMVDVRVSLSRIEDGWGLTVGVTECGTVVPVRK